MKRCKITLFTIMVLWGGVCVLPKTGAAAYRQTVAVFPLKNTADWNGTYDPGVLMAQLLTKSLGAGLEPLPGSDSREPVPENLAAQWGVTGALRTFHTALPIKLEGTIEEKRLARTAEVALEINLVHGASRRVVAHRVFSGTSDQGNMPLGFSKNSLDTSHPEFLQTSAGRVLHRLAGEVAGFIREELGRRPLEAQVVAVDPDKGEVTLNAGSRSGLEIRDDFYVYDLIQDFKDPLHGASLGDGYQRLGVVRVREVQDRFSVAVILAGEGFKAGNLVRARLPVFAMDTPAVNETRPKDSGSALPTPSAGGEGSRRITAPARSTFSRMNFFDLFGWSLDF